MQAPPIATRFSDDTDWVSGHEPLWLRLFASLAGRPGVRFLEVGSFEGRSALWWLAHVLTGPGSTLVCVDAWAWNPRYEQNFDHNLAASVENRRVEKIKAPSRRALAAMADDSFDAIYIDGSHEGRDVLLDGLLALPLLKRGGILLFDDYEWKPEARYPRHRLPKAGIKAFMALCDDAVERTHKGYQVAFRKR